MDLKISPLAPTKFPELAPLRGVTLATAAAGIKYAGRDDVLLATFEKHTQVAGVFTRSRCASAPVDWCREKLGGGAATALLVNSGNANAFTGKRGKEATALSAKLVSAAVGCSPDEVFLASTGVIGEPLPAEKFGHVLTDLAQKASSGSWGNAARAIMTTDTFPKLAETLVKIEGKTVRINGIAKGSGMIAPDMATMLSFIFTDAPIAAPVLQSLLSAAIKPTFNAITVDSDTSTSDTVLAFATGAAEADGIAPVTDRSDRRTRSFLKGLKAVLLDLALQVVRDGEGASKLVRIDVHGAISGPSAKRVAMAVANSPLVKTAIAGEDANWGRVVMAIGKAGEPADRDQLSIHFGDVRAAHLGERDPDYSEEAASAVMRADEIKLTIDLRLGRGKATVYTCDLTKQYVAINGDYRS